jgi:hypothetical protein
MAKRPFCGDYILGMSIEMDASPPLGISVSVDNQRCAEARLRPGLSGRTARAWCIHGEASVLR